MNLPPGFLDELRDRLSLSQVVGRKVMWDTRKSNQGKGDMWASCPFHQEKSASFHVDDRKGFYYCFGCHAKGDAIGFVRETENVSFMEAVEILAAEAGMPMPARDPRAQEKADARSVLTDVMEKAVQHFRLNLQTAAAADARAYLVRRGLDREAQARWDIGFAPDHGGVLAALTGKGVAPELVIEAGLAAKSERGGPPYDRFRGRIIFPIRDARGHAIALGGRAMAADAPAKYYNSPETPLFDKSRTLYNVKPAREAAGKGHPLIVAEGYMDVIALSEAGFGAAVAPLGTAITEEHLRMLWRIAPEPIIALDGDTAGLRAAMRTVDVALPLLEAGKSLRFAIMPDGLDPDDLIRQRGKGAMQAVLDAAIPMVQLLWQRETAGRVFDSPERKAALETALRDKTKLIADGAIRSHYDQAIRDLLWDLFRQRKSGPATPRPRRETWVRGRTAWDQERMPRPTAKNSSLAQAEVSEGIMRETRIFAHLLSYPELVADFDAQIERIHCEDPDCAQIRQVILKTFQPDRINEVVAETLGPGFAARLLGRSDLRVIPWLGQTRDAEQARHCLADDFARIFAARGQSEELREGSEEITGETDENLTWRLARAAAAIDPTAKGPDKDNDDDFEIAQNGARLNREERGSFSELLARIGIEKQDKTPK